MDIRPFRGWRYSGAALASIGRHIAPPYDILSGADKQAFLAAEPNNIVAVDLPHVPPKELGPDSEYQAAADLLKQWQQEGVMQQDPKGCLYAYEQTFTWAGKTYSRRAMICGVRATPFGQDVIPHEHTFAGPKADRLKLTQLTKVQLSPIFGFYSDDGSAAKTLWSAVVGTTPMQGHLREVGEKLWAVSDPAVIQAVSKAMSKVPVFIADGHHRYTTAMNYRDALKAAGQIDDQHEANFVMFALVERDDPGMLILPTHRIVRGLKADFSLEQLAKAATEFAWQRLSLAQADLSDPNALLSKFGQGAMGFIGASGRDMWVGVLKDSSAMVKAAPDQLPVWRELDVAILHKLIIDEDLFPWQTPDTAIEYTPDAKSVVAACRSGQGQLGVILQSTPLESVEKIATAGSAMPHKSTYFYPKLATGLVLKPLE